MNVKMQPSRIPGGGAFNALEVPYANGQVFLRGAVLVMSAGAVSEAASTIGVSQTNLYGVALQDAASNPGYGAANSPTVITGQRQTVMVAKADATQIFAALAYNGTTQVVSNATLAALVGTSVGLRKQASGYWTVDTAATGTSAYVTIVDYDPDTKIVLFKFNQSAVIA